MNFNLNTVNNNPAGMKEFEHFEGIIESDDVS